MIKPALLILLVAFALSSHAQSAWSLTGNSGTSPTTNWLGTNDDQRLVIKVNNNEAATFAKFLEGDGVTVRYGLGIGTSSPNHTFSVVGGNGFSLAYPGGTNYCYFEPVDGSDWGFGLWNGAFSTNLKIDAKAVLFGTRGSNAKVGIGTSTPNANAALDVAGNIFSSGKVAIGTTDMTKIGDNALAVNGSALFTKVKVKLYTGWPDFVFDKTYHLPSLEEIDEYIKANHHLPDVPAAAEVEKNGIDVGETQALLLKKIEELTIYIIQQSSELANQAMQIKKLQKKSQNKK